MIRLLINFKIKDFHEMLDEIDNFVVFFKDENKQDVEVITITSLREVLEQFVDFEIIDADKI